MKFSMTLIWILLVMVLSVLLGSNQHTAMGQGTDFPEITSVKELSYTFGDLFAISNNGEFVALSNISSTTIRNVAQNQQLLTAYWSNGRIVGWSTNGQYLAVITPGRSTCQFPGVETTVIIFDLFSEETNIQCIPFIHFNLQMKWSPIANNLLLINDGWVYDWVANEISSIGNVFPDRATIKDFRINFNAQKQSSNYLAIETYIWDIKSQAPMVEVVHEPVYDTEAQLEQNRLKICGLPGTVIGADPQCDTILEIPLNLEVFHVEFSSQDPTMLLWATHESILDRAGTRVYLADYKDTVIFMTDISSQETHEIFRLSSLEIENSFTNYGIDGSPNGKVIALTVGRFEGEQPRRANRDLEGTIILTLDWD